MQLISYNLNIGKGVNIKAHVLGGGGCCFNKIGSLRLEVSEAGSEVGI